jgi:large subunit ribosomal protein L6
MSRIGNQPIPIPAKVDVTLAEGAITVKGPLGTLTRSYGSDLSIEKEGDTLVCKAANESARAMHGTLRALVANMVKGVTDGYEKKLTLVGVGYRAQAAGDKVEPVARLLSPDRARDAEGHQGRDPATDGARSSRVSTSSRSARWQRSSAPIGRPNRTRARGSGTRTST